MLAQLLSSKPKTQLINLFLAHPYRSFSYTELRVTSGCSPQVLKQAIKDLSKNGFLITVAKGSVKYYQMNRHFALYPELVNLLRKTKKTPEDLLAKQAAKVGECKLIVLTGVFTGRPRLETDCLFVGKISEARLNKFLRLAEKFAEQEVNFTVFTPQEFEYRQIMNDRFLKNILENQPVIVVDKTKQKKIAKLVYKL